MSFKNKLFKEMLKMSSAATQKASKFCCSGPNPTYQKLKNLDPTQPMGQPNQWTTLVLPPGKLL